MLDKSQTLLALTEEPTEEQLNLLQKFGFRVNSVFLKVSEETSQDILLGYGKIFKHLNGEQIFDLA